MPRASRRHGEDDNSFQTSDTPQDRANITHRQTPYERPAPSVSPFKDAQIIGNVTNNRVYTAGGNLTVNDNDLVSTTLFHHVACGAMFDSLERQSAGRCHPGTRQKMMDQVMNWIMETDPAQTILWMTGSAGAGKSSLMQSICELLKDSNRGKKGASFFFSRGDRDRGKATKLFVTLAYQLAVRFPSVRAQINDALHRDPTLPTKSMAIQLRSLIIDPFLRCQNIPSPTPILFIDGLDECDADDSQWADIQCEIITLISRSLVEDNIPVRFIIASRPEYWISDSFEASPLSDITLRLSLRGDFDANKDIRRLLTERFEEIRLKKSRIMKSVATPWPSEHIVDRFVRDASGQYIYASTILKFVGDHPFKSPVEQLRILTTPGPHRAIAYSDLDRLYATIVSAYPESELMKRVLGGLIIELNPAAIQVFFEVPRTEITLVLDALRSLLDVYLPNSLSKDEQLLAPIFGPSFDDECISFCHLSFREFLLDEARSGFYHIDVDAVHSKMIGAFVGVIQRSLDGNYEIEPHISCNVGLLEYRRMMDEIVWGNSQDIPCFYFQDFFPLLHGMMETFRRFDPRRSMNHPACFMRDMNFLSDFLQRLDHQSEARSNSRIIHFKEPQHNPNAAKQDPFLIDSFIAIVSQLQNLTSMARKIGIRLLSLCEGFSITRILFLLQYLKPSLEFGVQIQDLLEIPGTTAEDSLSSIMQYRHIIDVMTHGDSCIMSLVDLGETSVLAEPGLDDGRLYWPIWTNYGAVVELEQKIGEGWLCRTGWTNQHVSLVCEFLKSIMTSHDNDWVLQEEGTFNGNFVKVNDTILHGFFEDGNISDIHGEDYFSNKYHLSFLEVMVDLEAWLALFPSRPDLYEELDIVTAPVLRWFNRQLANPKSVKLIEDHDASLVSKMTTTMNAIFQKCFVPLFTVPYFSRPVISRRTSNYGIPLEYIEIKVSSSSCSEESIDNHDCPCEYIDVDAVRDIHNEIFSKGPHAGGDQSVIPCSEWYPYLVAYLLNICVKYQYFQIESPFLPDDDALVFWELFPYIVQCLPYAQTTPQNLDALRAIKHLSKETVSLFPQLRPLRRFYPPSGFCSGAREFLKRYKPSVLSSDELSEFELWLRGITEVSLEDWDMSFKNPDGY